MEIGAIRLKGEIGQIRVGYQRAATLRDWTLIRSDAVGRVESVLSATIDSVDQYYITLPPTRVGVWVGKSWWIWSDIGHVEQVGSSIGIVLYGDPVAQTEF